MEGVILNRIPEINYPARPDVPKNTLGQLVLVRAAEARAENRILRQKSGELAADADEAHLMAIDTGTLISNIATRARQVQTGIVDVRRRIAQLDPEHAETFERYCETSASAELREIKNGRMADCSWTDWIEEADRAHVFKFLRWHVNTVERVSREPVIAEAIATQKEEYKTGVQRAVSEGWLHPDALTALREVDGIKVYAGDIFDTIFRQNHAYHTFGTRETVFSTGSQVCFPDLVEALGYVTKTTKHELNHAVLGRFMWRWLNEAATEHIAHSLSYGSPEVMDPGERPRLYPPYYREERRLLAYVLNEGSEKIPARLVTLAYSGPKGGAARNALAEAIGRSWAHATPGRQDGFLWLNKYVCKLEADYIRRGMTPRDAGAEAAIATLHRLQYQPEKVFNGDPNRRDPVFIAEGV